MQNDARTTGEIVARLSEFVDDPAYDIGMVRGVMRDARDALNALETQGAHEGVIEAWPGDAAFQLGDMVQKKGRASWRGKVVGWYRTELTSIGLAVESIYEPGSVQIYPQTALEALSSGKTVSAGEGESPSQGKEPTNG